MLNEIKKFLHSKSIEFKAMYHEPTKTSEDSAKARGEDLSIGGKSLILKIDDTFKLFVLSASKKLDSAAIKKYFHAKSIRFASIDELINLTGLVPGSVPPFGRPINDLDLYVDNSIVQNEKIAFNAGSLTDSIVMSVRDYQEVAHPQVFTFSK
jgi:prolyl-tRNA editing enzyme YbaK/EbsC (Cys-tRNA(Pro) deacylase)